MFDYKVLDFSYRFITFSSHIYFKLFTEIDNGICAQMKGCFYSFVRKQLKFKSIKYNV